jgi:SAM-dependent methyltransferase
VGLLVSFTDVDRSPDPGALISRLDIARADMAENKARVTRLAQIQPGDVWLDLGCGVGWDIADSTLGVGLDSSLSMLTEARRRLPTALLVAGDAASLPFGDGVLGGCRIERVLQHVPDPRRVLTEVLRCLRPGKRVAIFEPDWSSLRFRDTDHEVAARFVDLVAARHAQGDIGRRLEALLGDVGYVSVSADAEDIHWSSLEGLRRTFRFDDSIEAWLVADCEPDAAQSWLARVEDLDRQAKLRVDFTRYYVSAVSPATE